MTFAKIQSCVAHGLCTWEQIHETLANAQLSPADIDSYLNGEIQLGRAAAAMLRELIETGVVPATVLPATDDEDAPAGDSDAELPELLYCLHCLRSMPKEAPAPMMDAMFGTYRQIAMTEAWLRDRFGECDPQFGPYRFFAYFVLDGDHKIAVVWSRDDESGDKQLLAQLRARLDTLGVVSLRREIELLAN